MQDYARDCKDVPQSVVPQCQDTSSRANNDTESTEQAPSKPLELVSVETFLKTHNEEHDAQGEEDEAHEIVLSEQDLKQQASYLRGNSRLDGH